MYPYKEPEIPPPSGAMCSQADQRRPLSFDRIYFRDTFANISFFKSRLKCHQMMANTWNKTEEIAETELTESQHSELCNKRKEVGVPRP